MIASVQAASQVIREPDCRSLLCLAAIFYGVSLTDILILIRILVGLLMVVLFSLKIYKVLRDWRRPDGDES